MYCRNFLRKKYRKYLRYSKRSANNNVNDNGNNYTVLGILKIFTIISEGSYMISVASKKETAMKGLFKTSAGR